MAHLVDCPFKYADDRPVACDADDSSPADAEPPSSWRCWEKDDRFGRMYASWTDGAGNWGIQYRVPAGNESAHFAVSVTSRHAQRNDFAAYQGGPSGFFRIPGTFDAPPQNIVMRVIGVFSNGTDPAFENSNLDLQLTQFENSAWIVYRFPAGGATYQFQAMALWIESWLPLDVELVGADFKLNIRTAKGLSLGLSSQTYTPGDILLWSQGLPQFC